LPKEKIIVLLTPDCANLIKKRIDFSSYKILFSLPIFQAPWDPYNYFIDINPSIGSGSAEQQHHALHVHEHGF
jgi:hypothetical protein